VPENGSKVKTISTIHAALVPASYRDTHIFVPAKKNFLLENLLQHLGSN
jgi:hypothetical protein